MNKLLCLIHIIIIIIIIIIIYIAPATPIHVTGRQLSPCGFGKSTRIDGRSSKLHPSTVQACGRHVLAPPLLAALYGVPCASTSACAAVGRRRAERHRWCVQRWFVHPSYVLWRSTDTDGGLGRACSICCDSLKWDWITIITNISGHEYFSVNNKLETVDG